MLIAAVDLGVRPSSASRGDVGHPVYDSCGPLLGIDAKD